MGAGRSVGRAGLLVAAAVPAALLSGCGAGRIPTPPMAAEEVAEVTSGAPHCLAGEVLRELFGVQPASSVPRAPVSGQVPDGFEPVQVVLCRPGPLTLVEPAPVQFATAIPSLVPSGPTADARENRTPATVIVEEVTLIGDLAPLVTALARPSAPNNGRPCPAVWESKPQIYLVDAAGGVVRPRWPTTACGFLHKGAAEPLARLEEINSVDRTVEIDLQG